MIYSNILFDLDGTLTDSQRGIINSIKHALKRLRIEDYNPELLKNFLGPPLLDSFREFFLLSDSDAKLAVQYYREYYSVKGIFENKLFPGIIKLLALLNSKDKKVFMATSKPTNYALEIVEHFQIGQYFNGIYGSNMDGTKTDKAIIIREILDTECLDPIRTIMIGDRKYDIVGAANNQIHSIGIAYGYGSMEELNESQPTYICVNVKEIVKTLGLKGNSIVN